MDQKNFLHSKNFCAVRETEPVSVLSSNNSKSDQKQSYNHRNAAAEEPAQPEFFNSILTYFSNEHFRKFNTQTLASNASQQSSILNKPACCKKEKESNNSEELFDNPSNNQFLILKQHEFINKQRNSKQFPLIYCPHVASQQLDNSSSCYGTFLLERKLSNYPTSLNDLKSENNIVGKSSSSAISFKEEEGDVEDFEIEGSSSSNHDNSSWPHCFKNKKQHFADFPSLIKRINCSQTNSIKNSGNMDNNASSSNVLGTTNKNNHIKHEDKTKEDCKQIQPTGAEFRSDLGLFISQTTIPETQLTQSSNLNFGVTTETYLQPAEAFHGKKNVFEILRSVKINDSILLGIDHSTKFFDEVYEYRFVVLPRNHPVFELEDENLVSFKDRLLSEDEWRLLGIRQTRGWDHIGYSIHESHILLFRRPIGINAKTGQIESDSVKEKIKSHRKNIDHWLSKASHLRNNISRTLPYFSTLPTFGSTPFTRYTDPALNPTIYCCPINNNQNSNPSGWNFTYSHQIMNFNLTRKFTATIKSLNLVEPSQTNPFFNLSDEDYLKAVGGNQEKKPESLCQDEKANLQDSLNQKLIHDIDLLYAAIHMPLYAASH